MIVGCSAPRDYRVTDKNVQPRMVVTWLLRTWRIPCGVKLTSIRTCAKYMMMKEGARRHPGMNKKWLMFLKPIKFHPTRCFSNQSKIIPPNFREKIWTQISWFSFYIKRLRLRILACSPMSVDLSASSSSRSFSSSRATRRRSRFARWNRTGSHEEFSNAVRNPVSHCRRFLKRWQNVYHRFMGTYHLADLSMDSALGRIFRMSDIYK